MTRTTATAGLIFVADPPHNTTKTTSAHARTHAHSQAPTSPTGGGALSLEGLRGMIPGSDKAVSHRFDMANAHSNSPTVARTAPPRTGNLGGGSLFMDVA